MDDRMADSEEYDGSTDDEGRFLVNYILSVREWLKNLAEDRTQPMDITVYEALWQKIQSIDNDIKTRFQEVNPDSLNSPKAEVTSKQ